MTSVSLGKAELHCPRTRMISIKKNASSKEKLWGCLLLGWASFPLHVGNINDNKTIMVPDEKVKYAVSTLFKIFHFSRITCGVFHYFAEKVFHSLSMPMAVHGMENHLETLTQSHVLATIHNLTYTDAYVYDRYSNNKTINTDNISITNPSKRKSTLGDSKENEHF